MDEEEKSSLQFTQLKKIALNDYTVDDSSSKDYKMRLSVLRRNINESRGSVSKANNAFVSLVSCADSSTPNLQECQKHLGAISVDLRNIHISLDLIEKNIHMVESLMLDKKDVKRVKGEEDDIDIIKQEIEDDNINYDDQDTFNDNYNDDNYNEDEEGEELEDSKFLNISNIPIKTHDIKSDIPTTKFQCDVCNACLANAGSLKQHRQRHEIGRMKCQACNMISFNMSELKTHMLKYHDVGEIMYVVECNNYKVEHYICQDCRFNSTDIKALELHMAKVHRTEINIENKKPRHIRGKMKCNFCDEAHYKTSILKKHMKKEHKARDSLYVTEALNPKVKHYLCHDCHYSSTKLDSLEFHVNKKHKKGVSSVEDVKEDSELSDTEYKCTKCEYTTRNKLYYNDHISCGLKYRKCPYCDDHFTPTTLMMTRHIRKHGNVWDTGSASWNCPECDFKSKNLNTYMSHMYNVHKFGTSYHCDLCDFSTGTYENIRNHRTTHDEASYPCPYCSYIAQAKYRLDKHIYNSHSKFECRKCEMVFKRKDEHTHHLKDHQEVEDSPGEPFCDHCGKFFSTHKELFWHKYNIRKAKHQTGDFFCDQCNVKCARLGALTRHKKLKHTAVELPKVQCEEPGCEYKTEAVFNLKMHIEKVHKGIRWPCEICQFVGSYKADLKRHVKIVHEGFSMTCDQCNFSTPHQYVLAKHKEKEHYIDNV